MQLSDFLLSIVFSVFQFFNQRDSEINISNLSSLSNSRNFQRVSDWGDFFTTTTPKPITFYPARYDVKKHHEVCIFRETDLQKYYNAIPHSIGVQPQLKDAIDMLVNIQRLQTFEVETCRCVKESLRMYKWDEEELEKMCSG